VQTFFESVQILSIITRVKFTTTLASGENFEGFFVGLRISLTLYRMTEWEETAALQGCGLQDTSWRMECQVIMEEFIMFWCVVIVTILERFITALTYVLSTHHKFGYIFQNEGRKWERNKWDTRQELKKNPLRRKMGYKRETERKNLSTLYSMPAFQRTQLKGCKYYSNCRKITYRTKFYFASLEW